MHIDTGHNFAEVIEFRDRAVRDLDVQLIIGSLQASIDAGRIQRRDGAARESQSATNRDLARLNQRTQV
ncbi:sulfate adenylyltransferase subunit 2 [Acidimicrobiaceae bacterium]|nr:sulfate adenylyltransferase subunit 2 [Acidimicrobiaceae bacterium]